MIDLHNHILPGIDDGAADMDEAIAMAQIAVEDGIRTIVATSHVRGDQAVSPAEIRKHVACFNDELRKRKVALRVLAGAEVYYEMPLDVFAAHGLAGTCSVLLEFPHSRLPGTAESVVTALRHRGLLPIIAHPERNGTIIERPEMLLPLLQPGVLAQITAASLTGEMGNDVQRCAVHLLRMGAVHLIASDAHSATRRPPRMGDGVKVAARIVGRSKAQDMVQATPQRVLHDH